MKTTTAIISLKTIDRVTPGLCVPASLLAAITLLLSGPSTTFAGDATWDLNPTSGDWNTATNWTPATVPNSSADTATFAFSNTTNVSISANTEVNGITFTPAATNPYTISVATPNVFSRDLVISGAGITNDSGTMQNFVTVGGANFSLSAIVFFHSATAGSLTTFRNMGGETLFFDTASAGNATFINHASNGSMFDRGSTEFSGSSTAANGTFINEGGFSPGVTQLLFGSTTAANGTFINNGGTFSGAFGGATVLGTTGASAVFTNNGASASGAFGGLTSIVGGTAANAVITNNGASISGAGGGRTFFFDGTAGDAIITNNGAQVSGGGSGVTLFISSSTAGNAALIAHGGLGGGEGGTIFFEDSSTGGTSQVEVFGNGKLDISAHDAPGVTIGSIEGDGNVFLGADNLTVGSINLSTAFSGVIQDGGQNGGIGGSLTKIGAGTLDLTGANTYTGKTAVSGGVLQVDGSITSNVLVNRHGTLAGTGNIYGAVTGHGTVSPGDPIGILTVNSYTQPVGSGRLLIDIAGTGVDQFSVLDVLDAAQLNGFLDPVLLNGFIPSIGDEFTFLNYGSLSGAFSIQNGGIFDNGMERWVVTYHANDAVLTATKNVPDLGSTLLLLTLGLLALAYRNVSLRKQI
ncbi:MAG: hypothetical protein DME43_10200 [Verrucomicrobia bacterium]|nr:MAG: hypothetical protein DME43_10200 [Verrucomicrobiota bacterium]